MINWACEIYRVPLESGVAGEDGCYSQDYIDWEKKSFIFHFDFIVGNDIAVISWYLHMGNTWFTHKNKDFFKHCIDLGEL